MLCVVGHFYAPMRRVKEGIAAAASFSPPQNSLQLQDLKTKHNTTQASTTHATPAYLSISPCPSPRPPNRNETVFLRHPPFRRLPRAPPKRLRIHVAPCFRLSVPARGTLHRACPRPCRRPSYDAIPQLGHGREPQGKACVGWVGRSSGQDGRQRYLASRSSFPLALPP